MTPQPSARKLAGTILILTVIVVWAMLVASLAQFVGKWPAPVQALFYLVGGIIWIFPLRPLVRWMETGRFRSETTRPD
jgi:membrane protein implicated in regulation of membrane protease activity